MTDKELKEYFQPIEESFNQAIISNDVDEIKIALPKIGF